MIRSEADTFQFISVDEDAEHSLEASMTRIFFQKAILIVGVFWFFGVFFFLRLMTFGAGVFVRMSYS